MAHTLGCFFAAFAAASFSYAESRVGEYAIVLNHAPLAQPFTAGKGIRTASAADRRASIESSQARLAGDLISLGLPVRASVQTLLNAVFVDATAEQASRLRALPGVKYVSAVPELRHHMDRAVELMRVRQAWNSAGGKENAGAGIKIGILDSGIDLTHPGLNDATLQPPAGYPKGSAEFTNRKVIVARSYVDRLPNPDDNTPVDRDGYGTAVAMIAAGADARGPAGAISGVAPKAFIGNYKIFGTSGVNDGTRGSILIEALEQALADGMDIATVPLGRLPLYPPFARDPACAGETQLDPDIPADACDVLALAVENAVNAGLTVVVSAGNDGDAGVEYPTLNTINTPGTAPSAITVGASRNSFSSVRAATADAPAAVRRIDALFGDGPKPEGPLTAPLRVAAGNGLACSALPAGSLGGAIALISRGDCPFADKVENARQAGAVGVILHLTTDEPLFNPILLSETGIPAVMIGRQSAADLRAWVAGRPEAQVTLDPSIPAAGEVAATIAEFTSRGPSIADAAIKPEVIAVGADLYTATERLDNEGDLYDPSGYTYVVGSSYAVPIVAGAAALVKQQNPGFGPAAIKSALVNTAAPAFEGGAPAGVLAAGAGNLDVSAAVAAKLTASPATLSFGTLQSGSLPVSLTFQLSNHGAESPLSIGTNSRRATSAVDAALSIERLRGDNRGAITVSPETVRIGPGASAPVTVRLSGQLPDPGVYDGFVVAQLGASRIRVPFLYVVGDNRPHNIFIVQGEDFVGGVNESSWLLVFRVTDRYGIPVQGLPVQFRTVAGGGRIDSADAATDVVGKAAALVTLGSGEQEFIAEAGGLAIRFLGMAE